MKYSVMDSNRTLVFAGLDLSRKLKVFISHKGFSGCNFRHRSDGSLILYKLEPKLLVITHRKSHAFTKMLPKSVTLDELEQLLCTL